MCKFLMSLFAPNKWEERALITISAQIASVERKLNLLIRLNGQSEQLTKLSKQLEVSTDALAASVKAAKKQQQKEE
jgi:hypothetical protein